MLLKRLNPFRRRPNWLGTSAACDKQQSYRLQQCGAVERSLTLPAGVDDLWPSEEASWTGSRPCSLGHMLKEAACRVGARWAMVSEVCPSQSPTSEPVSVSESRGRSPLPASHQACALTALQPMQSICA